MRIKKNINRTLLLLAMVLTSVTAGGQSFVNLTSAEVKIDSVIPRVGYSFPLPANHDDSVYSVKILYPEYIDMPAAFSMRYDELHGEPLLSMPSMTVNKTFNRKKPSLNVDFCPYVERDGHRQILVSFLLKVESTPKNSGIDRKKARKAPAQASERYKSHSVLASGDWVKIRVPATGIYAITDNLVKSAGFSDPAKVKIYGYGGRLKDEVLTAEDLTTYDDLEELPTCTVGGKRLFHAQGPVSWSGNTATKRTRNPYSDYGYYFITEGDDAPATLDSAAFVATFYPSADDYHSLYEVDNYSWYAGGRNLFDSTPINVGGTSRYVFTNDAGATKATVSVNVSAGNSTTVRVEHNGAVLGTLGMSLGSYDSGDDALGVYTLSGIGTADTISITTISGGPARLDYISVAYDKPVSAPRLSRLSPSEPEIVGKITNQDHHGDGQYDMVIIIPTSQKLLAQAERLKAHHEEHDSMRVKIVPADELYNEFSSGTPDVGAYRRYLKMLYDRAETDDDMPKHVLLFGACVFDNRMATLNSTTYDPDDYLLCYESENSFSKLDSYVDDGFICLLDDGEGGNLTSADKPDVAVGRFPVVTESDAKIMVDKTINYALNKNAGNWENMMMFMGDDGDNNIHMDAANTIADMVRSSHPEYIVKKVMWDAYKRETSASGNSYPEVASVIKKQQQDGALIMNYVGHGNEVQVSHEKVLRLSDFTEFSNSNLPLWITAGCDFMPYDGTSANIGEAAVLNPNGGAVAFFGATRTVRSTYNEHINRFYIQHVLDWADGRPITIGEAQRLAKIDLVDKGYDRTVNKLQYQLLGDPALHLNLPQPVISIDSIAGVSTSSTQRPQLKAGMTVRVAAHVDGGDNFNGVFTATVRDVEETVTCLLNDESEASTPFTYVDRNKTIFSGSDSVRNGKIAFSFTVPKDISYGDGSGMINIYAVSGDKSSLANGSSTAFIVGGSQLNEADSIGPSVYCYLNSPSFSNGGKVNTTPFFVAEISDLSGINATGNGIGHDMQLVIDGEMLRTYNLNDNFAYDFGSYTQGSTYYSIPELTVGKHTLQFRAWDVYNNPTTVELAFEVVKGLEPTLFSIDCTKNPATTSTTFIINHDRMGSTVDVGIDVFDMSGRILWKHEESGVSLNSTYTVDWDLTTDGGGKLQTGVYLYRVRLGDNGSPRVSKAKKLIVINH